MQRCCDKCGKMLDDNEFYLANNPAKYPDGKFTQCKKCLTMHVDNWNPDTYMQILEDADVPYIKEEWNKLLEKYGSDPKKMTGTTILGRYLSKMRLTQFRGKTWADTAAIAEQNRQARIKALRSQGKTEEEIAANLAVDRTPPKPRSVPGIPVQSNAASPMASQGSVPADFEYIDEYEDKITDEEKTQLRLKWGRGYRVEEWIHLEQLYQDFMNSYDVQAAGHRDTLIKICKASLKADQLFDAGDIDTAQKAVRMYNDLMKQGNFTAAQNQDQITGFVDSVGELVAICEREGYIEKYYREKDNDKVDETLTDIKRYTRTLMENESSLDMLVEQAIAKNEQEDNPDYSPIVDDDEQDAIAAREEYLDFIDEEEALDEELFKSYREGDV